MKAKRVRRNEFALAVIRTYTTWTKIIERLQGMKRDTPEYRALKKEADELKEMYLASGVPLEERYRLAMALGHGREVATDCGGHPANPLALPQHPALVLPSGTPVASTPVSTTPPPPQGKMSSAGTPQGAAHRDSVAEPPTPVTNVDSDGVEWVLPPQPERE